ncbi:dynactin subunit 2 [Leptopilina heterotoma]|uniref:dynactin subunit 2 n=1 Tax=Leptopilina heterotoma TaxID=63436 RepID=UPI001CA7D6A8|nr:dynactin subunit 2 [Leptopilina heterotoma]
MADPKYANLPGIAYDQVDVYETTDLPESEQPSDMSKEESNSVEVLHCSINESFTKFKDKYVLSKDVDFSDRVSQKLRTGYNVGYGDWQVLCEKETPWKKLERLQDEIKELTSEMNELKEKPKDEKELKCAVDIMVQLEHVGKQLDDLKLHESLGNELDFLSNTDGSCFKQMVSQIELFKQLKDVSNSDKGSDTTLEKTDKDNSGMLKYQMMYLPQKAKLQEVARIGQLEQRLGCLENILGTKNKNMSTFPQLLKCQGILESIQQLGAKSALLDSSQLDVVESRVSALISKMDTIAQKKLVAGQDSNREQKVSEMYDILKKTEVISPILPQTLNRMITLNAIHQQATEFSKSLGQLEELQSQITIGLQNNKVFLKGVQDSFTNNLNIIQNNIASLDQRINNLSK